MTAKPKQCEICGEFAVLTEDDVCEYCYPLFSNDATLAVLFNQSVEASIYL